MKKLFVLALLAIFAFSACEKDDEEKTPTASFELTSTTLAENSTTAYQVKVTLSNKASKAITIPFTISGTAVKDVNYQISEENSLTIEQGETEGYILINPLTDNSFDNYSLILSLTSGTGFILDTEKSSIEITITNTGVLASTTIAFTQEGEILTNPLLAESIKITVGLSESVPFDLNVPIELGGTAINSSDYELVGLTDGKLAIATGAISADFYVNIKSATITDEKNLTLGFTTGDGYVVSSSRGSISIALINPDVDFATSWFNTANLYNYYFLSFGLQSQYDSKVSYKTKKYRWEDAGSGYAWASNSGIPYFITDPDKRNSWTPQTHIFYKKMTNWTAVKVEEQERYEMQGSDLFALIKMFPSNYIVGFGSASSTYEHITNGWFTFAPTQRDGKLGKVLLADQDLILYKAKDGIDWKNSTTDASGNTIYDWYADSRTALGEISNSSRAEQVIVKLEGATGTYDFTTNEIIIDITISCTDSNFSVADGTYLTKTDDGKYTLRFKFIPYA
ncbi:MAG: hypothetical protein AB7S48_14070 [Bacteroidales bacterium]